MPTVSRAPNIPRKIRDLKPRRWLRNERIEGANKSEAKISRSNYSRGASNESFGNIRSRAKNVDEPTRNNEKNSENEAEIDANHTNHSSTLMRGWYKFKLTPTRKKIKRLIAGLVLLTALKSIYFADLDNYQYSQDGRYSYYTSDSQKKPESSASSLRGDTDGVKSLSELLGDDYLGGKSGETKNNKSMSELIGTDKFISPSIRIDSKSIQSNSQNSFGISMSDSIGLSGQSFGSLESNSNSIQSSSYNSRGRSMSDSIESLEGNNSSGKSMQSASSNAFVHHSSGFQTNNNNDMYNSYPSHTVGDSLQKSLSHSDQYQQTDSALEQISNPRSAYGSTGEYHGLRSQSINIATDSLKKETGKSMLNDLQRPINDLQKNVAPIEEIRNERCSSHGGPYSAEEYSELIYWRNIQLDDSFTSPFYDSSNASFHRAKYLTFEMDWGGWNNMRIQVENIMVLAHSMGRTLVMPPKRQIAHGMRHLTGFQPDIHGRKIVSFDDFYDIEAISAKQDGLTIISMEEFLSREAVTGKLKSMTTDEAIYPPNNQVNWHAQRLEPLWDYITKVSRTFNWKPEECVLAFPAKGADDQHLFSMMADVLLEKDSRPFPNYMEFQGKPVNVDAPTIERFREVLAGRRKICMYDWDMHTKNDVVHFKAEENKERLILPYYAFIFFEDWRQETFAMRFVRDKLVYNDDIICLATRMVNTIRDYVRQHSPENTGGLYDAIHIRRADFQSQFPLTEMDANAILAGIEDEIKPGVLYVSTDERDLSFFEPLRAVYDLKFIGDFGDMLEGMNPQYFGIVEQFICARSRVFFGTYYSTFSAYIARLRGHYSSKENLPGHLSGSLQNTYYLPTEWKKEMTIYQALHVPFFAREFPIAWRDIDKR